MKTCSTCALWDESDVFSTTHHACMSEKMNEFDDYREFDTLVYPYCEGGVFRTGPGFGCVHHSERVAP